MKKSITRAVSRSAARFRRIHVIVRNEGCDPLQWHYNGLHEVSQDEFIRVRRRGSLSVSSSWRSHWVWISADCARSQRRGLCQSRRGGRVLLQRLRGRRHRRRRRRRLGRGLRRLLLAGHRLLRRRRPRGLGRRRQRLRRGRGRGRGAAAAAAAATAASARAGASVRVRWRRSLLKRRPRSPPVCGVFMAKGEGRLNPQGEHRTCNMCFDESVTQSNNMPKLTFTIPMNRRLTRLRTAEPREVLGICTA